MSHMTWLHPSCLLKRSRTSCYLCAQKPSDDRILKSFCFPLVQLDLQDLLELTPKKDVLFIIGDWNAKVGSQETPAVTGKFGLGIRNEAGQRLIEF